jgi:hypothetical protein
MLLLFNIRVERLPPPLVEPVQKLPDLFTVVIRTSPEICFQKRSELPRCAVRRKPRREDQLHAAFEITAYKYTPEPTQVGCQQLVKILVGRGIDELFERSKPLLDLKAHPQTPG